MEKRYSSNTRMCRNKIRYVKFGGRSGREETVETSQLVVHKGHVSYLPEMLSTLLICFYIVIVFFPLLDSLYGISMSFRQDLPFPEPMRRHAPRRFFYEALAFNERPNFICWLDWKT